MNKIRRSIKCRIINIPTLLLLVSSILILWLNHIKLKSLISYEKQHLSRNSEEELNIVKAKEILDIIKGDGLEIDWHDYERINKEAMRKGISEQGVAAFLKPSDLHEYDRLFDENNFNAFLSDHISVERSLPDIRHKGCRIKKYLKILPMVSIIIPFHNEHWSTLFRTIYSVLNRSPNDLIKEIILVDDFSTKFFLKKQLDDYVNINLTKTKIIRLPKRSGLIVAKLIGAKSATGEVLVFIDSHTEANVNWLPPLLEPIVKDYKTCVCPLIDMIDHNNFRYHAQNEGGRGAFDWELNYKLLPLLPQDFEHPAEPYKNPVMFGGLFAISSKFFWELGGYDSGLAVWGGEQYELSFKIWQCGGKIYDAPCSRVGHIFRKVIPYDYPRDTDFLGKNLKRVAEVWMDEYSEYLYMRKPQYRNIDPGDLSNQKKIRKQLKCKSFKWFLKEIAFDLLKRYPFIEPLNFASGQIINLRYPSLCVEMFKNETFRLKKCIKKQEQNFTLTWRNDLRPTSLNSMCWVVSTAVSPAPIKLSGCHEMGGNQFWHYDLYTKVLEHGQLSYMFTRDPSWSFLKYERCLDFDKQTKVLYVTHCNGSNKQKWKFDFIDYKANWENSGNLI